MAKHRSHSDVNMESSQTSIPLARVILRILVIPFMISMILECLIFNLPHWSSLRFQEPQNLSFTEGVWTESEAADYGYSDVAGLTYVEFDAGGSCVNNVNVDLGAWSNPEANPNFFPGAIIPLQLFVTDEANCRFFRLPSTEYVERLDSTHFIRVHLSGGSNMIRLTYLDDKQAVTTNSIVINAVQPFELSKKRILLVFCFLAVIMIFEPHSFIYRLEFDLSVISTKIAVYLTVIPLALFVASLSLITGRHYSAENTVIALPAEGGQVVDSNQYNHLANAFIAGRVSIDLPVAETLRQLENPYDRNNRVYVMREAREHYYMDYAYYKGQYYSYFGPLPALLLFVPFKLLTGHDLQTNTAVTILALTASLGIGYLMAQLYQRFFRHKSVGLYCLATFSTILCCGSLNLSFYPVLYSVPILSALSLASLGLGNWISATNDDGSLSRNRLLLGGVLVALTLPCRPAFILCSLIAFPIFAHQITVERRFFSFSKDALLNTALVILPFIIVAIPCMVYNQARFGSPFDFGATYNLTGTDMTRRGFVLARIPGCLFQYLFQPLNMSISFPFISKVSMATDYQGLWFFEPFFGGFFSFAPVCYALFLIPSSTRRLREDGTAGLITTLLLVSLCVLVLDSQVASITPRYFGDFGWLILMATWLVIWTIVSTRDSHDENSSLLLALFLVTLIGMALNCIALLSDDRYGSLVATNPNLYYQLKSWLLCRL